MSIIKVNCVDQTLVFENTPVIASGGLEENFVQFSFCSQWDGFAKTAVFWRSEAEVYHNLLDEENTCQVPPEVTAADGVVYFGVFGVDPAGRQRTSEVLTYAIVKGAIVEGTKPSDPTPDIYTQILEKHAEVLQNVAQYKADTQKQIDDYTAGMQQTVDQYMADTENMLNLMGQDLPKHLADHNNPHQVTAEQLGAVKKAGDTMTGNLTVEKSTPIINLNDTVAGTGGRVFSANNRVYAQIANVKDSDANRRQLVLANSAAVDKAKALALHDIVEGVLTAYYFYHEGNKPTPAELGAVAKAGDTMTGDLVISKAGMPILSLENQTTGRTFRLNAGGDNTAGIYNRKDADNVVGLYLGIETSTMDNLAKVMHINNGVANYYSVIHTGNLSGRSIGRVATGSYDGAGVYGSSVTLTCGFKPAFAIIYRKDGSQVCPVDLERDGAWGSQFAVLVPYEDGSAIGVGMNWVTVESGDTYLKFTPNGHELNGAGITYNYVIVGN